GAPFGIDSWNQDKVDMIGHHYRNVEVVSGTMIVKAAFDHDSASPVRHDPALLCHKCNEVWFVVTLQVRKVAAIENHGNAASSTKKLQKYVTNRTFTPRSTEERAPPPPPPSTAREGWADTSRANWRAAPGCPDAAVRAGVDTVRAP